jgi:nitroreductase
MSNEVKRARPGHPIDDKLAERWSPYVFAARSVSKDDLRSLFEAARWAASSYNEQPWSYIVATREEPQEFARVLACLVELNQAWAKQAPVLALGVVSRNFARNGKPNKAAIHDLGAASASLTFEATARGLAVHQMIGIEPERARETFAIPDGWEAYTGLAIGYAGDPAGAAEKMRERDTSPRPRKPLHEFVFGGAWGKGAPLVASGS